jgi:hypothetical protein
MSWSRTHHTGNQCLCNWWHSGGAVPYRLQYTLEIFFHAGRREKEQHAGCRAPGVEKCVDRSTRDLHEVSGRGFDLLLAQRDVQDAFEQIRTFFLAVVNVQGGPPPGGIMASMMK